jgi:hypothetical protein
MGDIAERTGTILANAADWTYIGYWLRVVCDLWDSIRIQCAVHPRCAAGSALRNASSPGACGAMLPVPRRQHRKGRPSTGFAGGDAGRREPRARRLPGGPRFQPAVESGTLQRQESPHATRRTASLGSNRRNYRMGEGRRSLARCDDGQRTRRPIRPAGPTRGALGVAACFREAAADRAEFSLGTQSRRPIHSGQAGSQRPDTRATRRSAYTPSTRYFRFDRPSPDARRDRILSPRHFAPSL